MNVFITGTDTNAGKTVVSSWICLQSRSKYWKPIQTGTDFDYDVVKNISPKTIILESAIQLRAPLSPYDSANMENKTINVQQILDNLPDKTVVEGSGGVLVPISEDVVMADIIKMSNSAVVLVAQARLGMENHILLSVESLRKRGIEILGIIISGELGNYIIKTIEKFSKLKVLTVLPFFDLFCRNDASCLAQQLKKIQVPEVILGYLR